MFINHEVVAVVFRLINFILLIVASFFIFKKYIKPDLLFLLTKKRLDQEFLLAQQTTLEKQQVALDALLRQQAVQCEEFRARIDTWKKVVIAEQEQAAEKHTTFMVKINQRHTEIAQEQENQHVKNIVTQEVVAHLEKSLSLHFKDPKKSTDYLNTILHFMDERI